MSIVILTHFHVPSHRLSPSLVLDVNVAFTTTAAFSLNKQIDRIPRDISVNRTGRDVQTNVYKKDVQKRYKKDGGYQKHLNCVSETNVILPEKRNRKRTVNDLTDK